MAGYIEATWGYGGLDEYYVIRPRTSESGINVRKTDFYLVVNDLNVYGKIKITDTAELKYCKNEDSSEHTILSCPRLIIG